MAGEVKEYATEIAGAGLGVALGEFLKGFAKGFLGITGVRGAALAGALVKGVAAYLVKVYAVPRARGAAAEVADLVSTGLLGSIALDLAALATGKTDSSVIDSAATSYAKRLGAAARAAGRRLGELAPGPAPVVVVPPATAPTVVAPPAQAPTPTLSL